MKWSLPARAVLLQGNYVGRSFPLITPLSHEKRAEFTFALANAWFSLSPVDEPVSYFCGKFVLGWIWGSSVYLWLNGPYYLYIGLEVLLQSPEGDVQKDKSLDNILISYRTPCARSMRITP